MMFKKLLQHIEISLSSLFLLALLVLSFTYERTFQWKSALIIFTFIIIVFIFSFELIKNLVAQQSRFKTIENSYLTIKNWFPLLAIIIIYENLREYTGVINPNPIDELLYKMDLFIFGLEPTIWIQKFVTPIGTDIFSAFYATYFLLPLLLAFHLFWKKNQMAFSEISLGLCLLFYTAFVTYIICPAGPPRFFFDESVWGNIPSLYGQWGIFEMVHTVSDKHNPVMHYASFPSLHIGLSFISLRYVIRFRNELSYKNFWIISYLITFLGIAIATVYLRHHWVPDIIAGLIFAQLNFYLAASIKQYLKKTKIEDEAGSNKLAYPER